MFLVTGGLFAASELLRSPWLDKLAAKGMYTCTPENCVDYSKIFPKVNHEHLPDGKIRAREGRPPSEWLRSLTADEIRKWLPTVKDKDMPVAEVEGMTAQYHLVHHHYFTASHIKGLTRPELIKLHSCAHYGF